MLLSRDTIRRITDLLTRPGRFFTGRTLRLGFSHVPAEEIVWEVFQGRLLDPAHTSSAPLFRVVERPRPAEWRSDSAPTLAEVRRRRVGSACAWGKLPVRGSRR